MQQSCWAGLERRAADVCAESQKRRPQRKLEEQEEQEQPLQRPGSSKETARSWTACAPRGQPRQAWRRSCGVSCSAGLQGLWPRRCHQGRLAGGHPVDRTALLDQSSTSGSGLDFLLMLGSDSVRVALLSACTFGTAAVLQATCRELSEGTRDGQGRLLAASAALPAGLAVPLLRRLSPHLLRRLRLPSAAGEEVLSALAALRHELRELRDVSIHLAAPRLPRVASSGRDEHLRAASVLARALTLALPPSIIALAADLRGGGSLSGDIALAEFSSAIPKGLVRLRLDLNHFNAREIRAVATALPETLLELQLLFHGRCFTWLGIPPAQDDGLEALSESLPTKLEKLRLMLECSDGGGTMLCGVLPKTLRELDLDLRLLKLPRGSPAQLPQALAQALSPQLLSLHLRLIGWSIPLSGVKLLAQNMPRGLQDLRLDIGGRSVGDEGVGMLAASLPSRLMHLALCLRSWRFTEQGALALAEAMPPNVRRLMLAFSGTSLGAVGAQALVDAVPPMLEVLNFSFTLCRLGPEGEEVLQPLAQRWSHEPRSWVRVREVIGGVCNSLEGGVEWEAWDE